MHKTNEGCMCGALATGGSGVSNICKLSSNISKLLAKRVQNKFGFWFEAIRVNGQNDMRAKKNVPFRGFATEFSHHMQ